MPAAATVSTDHPYDPSAELDRQADQWAAHGHRLDPDLLNGLRAALDVAPTDAPTPERVPFVLVVPAAACPAAPAMARTRLRDKAGTVNQHAGDIDEFAPISTVDIPTSPAYLLLDVERGSEFCNVPPEPAVVTLAQRDRTPLTVAEGIALITMHPRVLQKNHCFSLAGSRRSDRRVPALWISQRAPHLGWCFAGTPHSWLGVASARDRICP